MCQPSAVSLDPHQQSTIPKLLPESPSQAHESHESESFSLDGEAFVNQFHKEALEQHVMKLKLELSENLKQRPPSVSLDSLQQIPIPNLPPENPPSVLTVNMKSSVTVRQTMLRNNITD
jgi:hypothetical protein